MNKTNEQLAIESLFRILKVQGAELAELEGITTILETRKEEVKVISDIIKLMHNNMLHLTSRIEQIEAALDQQIKFNDKVIKCLT